MSSKHRGVKTHKEPSIKDNIGTLDKHESGKETVEELRRTARGISYKVYGLSNVAGVEYEVYSQRNSGCEM